ncbi:hypothetical protein [Desertivibrio insolitus]|uniref:hypothetical protein n=1 Tax=Herbiconiux sp. SYSU D00978 TaxID=2812562 RepID=UPI001A97CCF2|nr:hypothetical protein [Herbiconiux sp. SYSU D00978]
MTIPAYDDAKLVPLDTDAAIERRVADLIGRANRRQLWLIFLDEHQRQLPTMIPVDDLPLAPEPGDGDMLAGALATTAEMIGAASVVLVWERYADDALTVSDRRWARLAHDACAGHDVPLRAMLLSHRHGVRWIAQDDYRF